MKRYPTFTALLLALFLLGGCGFKPMYAENSADPGLQEAFSGIEIAPVPDRLGQVVRNHLLDRLNIYGQPSAPNYLLQIQLTRSIEGFGFRSDESVTRESLTLEAAFNLIDSKTGEVVLQDLVRSVHSYDVVQSDFANYSAQQDAEARTALQVSEMITANLGMYFKSRP